MLRTPAPGSPFDRWPRVAWLVPVALSMLLGSCNFLPDFGAAALECKPLSNAVVKARAKIDDDGGDVPGDPPSDPPAPPPPTFAAILDSFCGFDINRDGTPEIDSLKPLFTQQEPYAPMRNGVAIVFVDPRLVTDDPAIGVTPLEMMIRLSQLRQDLFSDGYFAYFVRAKVYAGTRHQDGRTLLAMRRVLKKIRAHYPLQSTLLIGSFPDASIVRTVLIKSSSTMERPASFQSGSSPITGYVGDYLQIASELVTTRAEIVLTDLDGNWEGLYNEVLRTPNYRVIPPIPSAFYPFENEIIPTETYDENTQRFEDVFHIVDHNAQVSGGNGSITMALRRLAEPSPEATAADKLQPNRIARPEIAVGRINPRSIAVQPFTDTSDIDGKQPLNSAGVPQTLRFTSETPVKWRRDATLERKLVADYLGRAHAFRLGRDRAIPPRVSSIRGPDNRLIAPASFNDALRPAFGPLLPVQSVSTDNASALELIKWFKRPAALRGITVHCDPVNCQFREIESVRDFEAEAGSDKPETKVWRWYHEYKNAVHTYTPSFEKLRVDANFHVYRTLWENKVLAGSANMFIIHDGCEVMRPSQSAFRPYNDKNYGQFDDMGTVANGESLMFYANGLGLMARNKVFNDTPGGFSEAVRQNGGRFGYGWKGYFFADAARPGLDERAADPTSPDRRERTLQRKRSYFWNMIGDPTLKLRY